MRINGKPYSVSGRDTNPLEKHSLLTGNVNRPMLLCMLSSTGSREFMWAKYGTYKTEK